MKEMIETKAGEARFGICDVARATKTLRFFQEKRREKKPKRLGDGGKRLEKRKKGKKKT